MMILSGAVSTATRPPHDRERCQQTISTSRRIFSTKHFISPNSSTIKRGTMSKNYLTPHNPSPLHVSTTIDRSSQSLGSTQADSSASSSQPVAAPPEIHYAEPPEGINDTRYTEEWRQQHHQQIVELSVVERELHMQPVPTLRDGPFRTSSGAPLPERTEPVAPAPHIGQKTPTERYRVANSVERTEAWALAQPQSFMRLTQQLLSPQDKWDPRTMDSDTVAVLQDVLEEFVADVTEGASKLAAHRGDDVLRFEDLKTFLEMHHGELHVPKEVVEVGQAHRDRVFEFGKEHYGWL